MEIHEYNNSIGDNKRVWKNIKIHGTEYIISTSILNNDWKISLSNLIEIWTETISKDVASARCQSLNLLLDLDSFDIKETLDIILNDIPKHATEKSLGEIKLETSIDGIAFKFSINLAKGSPEQFWNEITKPLCQSSIELQRRHQIVVDLINRKDEELLEYKLSGARLTRKNIETLPYGEKIFENQAAQENFKSEDCVAAFQSMMKYRSLSNNGNDCLPRGALSDFKPVEPKLEGVEAAVDVINAELQTDVKMETETKNSPVFDNEALGSRMEIIEEHGVGEAGPSASESRINARMKQDPGEHSTVDKLANATTTSVEQGSKKPKRPKSKPKIYDFIP